MTSYGEKGPTAPPSNSNSEIKEKGPPAFTSHKNIQDANSEVPNSTGYTVLPQFPQGMSGSGNKGDHAAAPFWSHSIPPPAMYGPAGVYSLPTFHAGAGQATLSGHTVPQWTTPVLTSTPMQSSNQNAATPQPEKSNERVVSSRKSRTRKRCQRESSSSSGESLERESMRWRETSIRDKSRSPQPPKMPIFTGSGTLSWEAFIYQFERTSSRRNWDNDKKLCRFLDCLSEVALEYARRSHPSSYEELRKYMKRRFSKKEEASSARRQLQYVRQMENESVEEFAERVHFLTMDGYFKSSTNIIDQIGTEAFLRGCKEKDAARIVIEKNPRTINEALKWIKSSLANQRAIYGARSPHSSRSPQYVQRQVTFSDAAQSDSSPQRPSASTANSDKALHSDVRDLVSLVGQLLREGRMSRSASPDNRSFHNRSSRDFKRYDRSPTPPVSRDRLQSSTQSRSPSPRRFLRQRKDQDNVPFKRSTTPPQGTTSPINSQTRQALNKQGSD